MSASNSQPTKIEKFVVWAIFIAFFVGWALLQGPSLTPEQRAEKERLERQLAAEKRQQASTPEGLALAIYTEQRKPQTQRRDKNILQLTVDDESFLTASFLHLAIKQDAAKFFSKVFDSNPDIQTVLIVNRATLIDVKGHTSIDPVLRVTMNRDTAAEINWKNFRSENLDKVADEYWEHPALTSD
ncbi:MAG: hypothetical protein CTY31_12345 [Hyphomicrobium sp.]|nr:MAG: hypothetical protein CTY39_06275 [Hyphomicrobium sp.]PPC98802.1 MAG: hypothetical protein CTY31_12345 [Hyphomicrobium sp.]